MKLIKAHIKEFRSINDSTEFEIDDITCLVGKNESGKTAILQALYKLNPIITSDSDFDVTDDYPRRYVNDYNERIENGSKHSTVIDATFSLEKDDIQIVENIFGKGCFVDKNPIVTVSKGYSFERSFSGLDVNDKKTLIYLIKQADITSETKKIILEEKDIDSILIVSENLKESDEGLQDLIDVLKDISENSLEWVIYNNYLRERLPKFLYFDEYYQMTGQDNINALKQRIDNNKLKPSDHPLIGLIKLARLDLDNIINIERTEELFAKLEAAENQLTAKVLKYWSQNKHLRMKFEIRSAQKGDPEGMTTGMNIWGRVNNTKHMVSTSLLSRSKGFVWFFSFVAWYSSIKDKNVILLLDEPGLTLHAKAQADLLKYFEDELRPSNQIIYTTHSPFLVDPSRFDRIRIVQDLSIDVDNLPENKQGTKITTEVLEAGSDSLFPLQAALGYEIHQTLFIGPNSLVVEGVSDLLYLNTISRFLQSKDEPGLNDDWVITPVGGIGKVATFVALIGAQKDMNLAVLIDYQDTDKQIIENLYKKKLMEKKRVLTFADFVLGDEADIEDLFNPGFYLALVNAEYGSSIKIGDLPDDPVRIVKKIEKYLESNPMPNDVMFNHYRPSRYFSENINNLKSTLTNKQLDRFRDIFKMLNKLLSDK